jgi:soluble lytic murein transglycosylase-like protein
MRVAASLAGRQRRWARASPRPSTPARAKQRPERTTRPLASISAGRVGISGSWIRGIQRAEASNPRLSTRR